MQLGGKILVPLSIGLSTDDNEVLLKEGFLCFAQLETWINFWRSRSIFTGSMQVLPCSGEASVFTVLKQGALKVGKCLACMDANRAILRTSDDVNSM